MLKGQFPLLWVLGFSVLATLMAWFTWSKAGQTLSSHQALQVDGRQKQSFHNIETNTEPVEGNDKQLSTAPLNSTTELSSTFKSKMPAKSDDSSKARSMAAKVQKVPSTSYEKTPEKTGFKVLKSTLTESDELFLSAYRLEPHRGMVRQPKAQPAPWGPWSLSFEQPLCGRPLFIKDALFVSSYDQGLYRLSLKDGSVLGVKKLWYQPIGNPLYAKGQIVIPQRNGNISSYEPMTFQRLWNSRSAVQKDAGIIDISISGATILGDKVAVSKHWGNLYLLDLQTGRMLMDPGVPYESRITTPAVEWQGRIYYSNVGGEILCYGKRGTRLIWKASLPQGYATSLKVEQGRLYMSTSEKTLCVMDAMDHEVLWEKTLPNHAFNSIEFHGNQIIVAAGDLLAFSKEGQLRWKLSSPGKRGMCRGEPLCDADGLFIASQEGKLMQYRWSPGEAPQLERTWSIGVPIWNGISKSGSLLALSDIKGGLHLIDLKKEPLGFGVKE